MKVKNINTGKEYIVVNKEDHSIAWPKSIRLLEVKGKGATKTIPLSTFKKHFEEILDSDLSPKEEAKRAKALVGHIKEEIEEQGINPDKTDSKDNIRNKAKDKLEKKEKKKNDQIEKQKKHFDRKENHKPAPTKAPAAPQGKDIITLKEICTQLGIEDSKARKILRKSGIEQPFNRWEWDKKQHKAIIEKVTKLLKK